MMANRILATAGVLTALAAVPLLAATPRFARLGAFEGPVEVQLDAADSWRPAMRNLPLPEGTRIRTGLAAKVGIELDDTSVFRMAGEGLAELSDYTRLSGGQWITVISLDHGLAYFSGEPGTGNSMHLMVPGAQASLKQGSRIRLMAREQASEVAILEGATRFTMRSAEMDLHQGQSAQVTVPDSTHFSLFREITPLESDQWNEELDRAQAQAPASRLDMDRAGKWIRAGDFGTVWQPAAEAGWAPFRQGRWMWFQSVGFTWVGAEPWGYTPYHEGRWLQHSDLGWVWVPDAHEKDFTPGDVFWARTATTALWGALAPGEQWSGTTPPHQFAAFNVTGGAYVSGAREIAPSLAEELPKDLLKAFSFTPALPSPAFSVARLRAAREPLRSKMYSAVEVAPDIQPVTQAPPQPAPEAPVVAEVAPPPTPFPVAPLSEAEPVVSDVPQQQGPIVPGIIVVRARDRSASASKGSGGKSGSRKNSVSDTSTLYAIPVAGNYASLTGRGTPEAAPLIQRWSQLYRNAQVSYSAASGGGVRDLRQGKLDFLVADMPPEGSAQSSMSALLSFAAGISAVVPVYNVPGVHDSLRLTGELLAEIYLGDIRYWNDPRIMAANPKANLPQATIILVNRLDASSTTYIWTDYLSKISPVWKARMGAAKLPTWPVTGLSARGDDGVGTLVQQTLYSLSYVDWNWAAKHDSQVAALRNRSGEFVYAQLENVTAAAIQSGESETSNLGSITDAKGHSAYPVCGLTYLTVKQVAENRQNRAPMADFLKWMLSDGQKETSNFGLAPLPPPLAAREKRRISMMSH